MNLIDLVTGQVLFSEPEWHVVLGGSYSPDALVECARSIDPNQKCAFYAQFISAGGRTDDRTFYLKIVER